MPMWTELSIPLNNIIRIITFDAAGDASLLSLSIVKVGIRLGHHLLRSRFIWVRNIFVQLRGSITLLLFTYFLYEFSVYFKIKFENMLITDDSVYFGTSQVIFPATGDWLCYYCNVLELFKAKTIICDNQHITHVLTGLLKNKMNHHNALTQKK